MRWILALTLVLILYGGPPPPAAAQDQHGQTAPTVEPEIWFNPWNLNDWQSLFLPGAPWPQAMSKVKVITLEPQFIWSATDAQILAAANFAQAHHMRLNMDVQAVEKIQNDTCGTKSEGYTWINDIRAALSPLLRLGVHLDSIHMDEPVWFGRYEAAAADGCNLTVDQLVQRTAIVVNLVTEAYPNIQVVEIEPIPDLTDQSDWLQSEVGFQAGLSQLIGRRIEAIQLDVNWHNPEAETAISTVSRFVHERNMKLGIIYDGLADSGTNAGWIGTAIDNFDTTEGEAGILPEQAVFATWVQFPTNDLPETDPTTQTWLLNRYAWPRSHIQASFSGQSVNGQLTTAVGYPIVGATVAGYVPGVHWSATMPLVSSIGVVPSNAVSVLIGMRLNVECRCDGMNDVLVGPIQYRETANGSNAATLNLLGPDRMYGQTIVTSETVGGTAVTRIIAPLGAIYAPNSAFYPVTVGASYQFSASAVSTTGAGWYGNIFLLWVDANGNSISRANLVPNAGRWAVASATTDANGRFFLPRLPRIGPGSTPVSVRFDGGGQYRAAVWTP